MSTNFTRNDDNTVTLSTVLEGEAWKKAQKKALNRAASSVNLKGFRKGKVPAGVIRKTFGSEALYELAAEDAASNALRDLEEEYDVVSVDRPSFRIENPTDESVTLIFTVPVAPEAEIGNWKELGVAKAQSEFKESDVDDVIDSLLAQEAEQVLVEDAPAELGDTVEIDFDGVCEGSPIEGGSAKNHSLELGSNSFIPGFEDALVGVKGGETRDIQVTFPEDYPNVELAGKPAEFKVTVHDVYRSEKPELTDEFVKNLDKVEADSVDALRELIHNNLTARAQQEADRKFQNDLYAALRETMNVEAPESMVEDAINNELTELDQRLRNGGIGDLQTYLQITGMTLDSMRESMRENAEASVLDSLALDAIARAENIAPTDEEVENYLKETAEMLGRPVDELKKVLDKPQVLQGLRRIKAEELLIQANSADDAGENEANASETD